LTKVIWASFQQLSDEYGDVLNGGKIHTYTGGTTTPKATYTDSTGNVANANPIVLSASGRKTGGIWINKGEAYKFVLTASDDTELDVIDNVVVGEAATTDTQQLLIPCTYCGTPGVTAFMGGYDVAVAATLPVDFDGASPGNVLTNPASTCVISVQKNGIEVGTVSIANTGVFTYATTGGATVPLVFGDTITFISPDTVTTAANFSFTLVADLA
jgi:hypothetical protein